MAKQSTVELPSETSSSSIKPLVIAEQPAEIKPPVKNKPVVEQSIEEESLPTELPAVKQSSETRFPFEPEMVRVSPGKFLMGSFENELGRWSTEGSQHEVIIAYTFEISKFEVTIDEYDAFANATKRKLPGDEGWGRGRRPVINVSFNDAQAYVKWLSKQTGKQYRLPSEAEWELPPVRARKQFIGGGMTSAKTMRYAMAAVANGITNKLLWLVRLNQMYSGFMTPLETFGNGHKIAGTETTVMHRLTVQLGRKPTVAIVLAGWFGAVRGKAASAHG